MRSKRFDTLTEERLQAATHEVQCGMGASITVQHLMEMAGFLKRMHGERFSWRLMLNDVDKVLGIVERTAAKEGK